MPEIESDPTVSPDEGVRIQLADGQLLVRADKGTQQEQRRLAEKIVHDLQERDRLTVRVAELETEILVLRAKLDGMRSLIDAGHALLDGHSLHLH